MKGRITEFEGLLEKCLEGLKQTVEVERAKLAHNKEEFQRHVAHVHEEFEKIELKRIEDKKLDVLLINELKDENKSQKTALELLVQESADLREKLRESDKRSTFERVREARSKTLREPSRHATQTEGRASESKQSEALRGA